MPNHVVPEASGPTERLRRHWAIRAATILIPVLVSSIGGYVVARREASQENAFVKNKAEAGYQLTDKSMDRQESFNRALTEDLQKLKVAVSELQRQPRRPAKRQPAVTPPPALPSLQLAPNLDKALEQIQQQQAPATPPAPDAAKPR